MKLHPKRVEKIVFQKMPKNFVYEWTESKNDLIILVQDVGHLAEVKIHSKRVEKMQKHTREEWGRCKNTLNTSGEDAKTHSTRVGKIQSTL